ncbi:MAG: hypothetical protein HC896_07135 [Bacteroidales bacterium]|nr:hypothetical protein [Bacteroidales bacterium]
MPKTSLGNATVEGVFADSEKDVWVSTLANGLYRLNAESMGFIQYNKYNGLSVNDVKTAFEDRENNIWIGTYGSGLDLMQVEAFVFQPSEATNAVLAIDSVVYFGQKGKIMATSISLNMQPVVILSQRNGLPDDMVSALCHANGKIWIGTQNNGVYTYSVVTKSFAKFNLAGNTLGNAINHIINDNENIWFSTKNGVYQHNLITKETRNYTTREGLPYNNISQIYVDGEKNAWAITKGNAVYAINAQGQIVQMISFHGPEIDFVGMQKSGKTIWLATYGSGVFRVQQDSIINITANNGLKSNYCYSIIQDPEKKIWVGHRFGLSTIMPSLVLKTFGPDEGFSNDFAPNGSILTPQGTVVFATDKGLITYNHKNNKKSKSPPQLNITRLTINEKEIDIDTALVLPYGIYKLGIDYIGLNYRAPQEVSYRLMMKGKGFDETYGKPVKTTSVVYNNIRDGQYSFMLTATDQEGVASQTPLVFNLKVMKPFWKSWWFISLMLVFLVAIVYTIIVLRERKQKKLQEYLEVKLAERTKEVVEQKRRN